MTPEQFVKRFSMEQRAPEWFLEECKKIQEGLDCRFNLIEELWQVIKWEGVPFNSKWHWVLTIRDHEAGGYASPQSQTIERLRHLKKVFEEDVAQKMIEEEEAIEAGRSASFMEAWSTELSKDLRKPLLAAYDGQVSTWNHFIG